MDISQQKRDWRSRLCCGSQPLSHTYQMRIGRLLCLSPALKRQVVRVLPEAVILIERIQRLHVRVR